MQMLESLKRNPMRWLLVAAFAAFAVSAFALLTSFPAAAQTSVDYDKDNDGLIEVDSIQKLDAIRYDLDGDGSVINAAESAYYDAFSNPHPQMGCSQESGCIGYELAGDINFDTNGNGVLDEGDLYYSRNGWQPIGGTFNATFDGNGYAVRRLYVNRNASNGDIGLFAGLGQSADVKNVEFIDADLTMRMDQVGVESGSMGILAGQSSGRVRHIAVRNGALKITAVAGVTDKAYVGGIIGYAAPESETRDSYTASDVRVSVASYAHAAAGGLIGHLDAAAGGVENSYSHAAVFAPNATAGGLVGSADGGAVFYSYAAGPVDGATAGGLLGVSHNENDVLVRDSYWDAGRTGVASSAGGESKTASELQAADATDGMYEKWHMASWDFVDGSHYPLLKATWNGTYPATWEAFGEQDPDPAFASDASIPDIVLLQGALIIAHEITTLPEVETRGNGTTRYSIGDLPDGVTFEPHQRQLAGTAHGAMAKTALSYHADDNDAPGATLTFNLSVAPQAPERIGAEAAESTITLVWLPNPDPNVTWELKQNNGDFAAVTPVTFSVPTENGQGSIQFLMHEITGLSTAESHTLAVRGIIGTGDAKVNGREASVVTEATGPKPNPPTHMQIDIGDQEANIRWTASAANECSVIGYEIDLMRVERSDNGDTFHVVTSGRSIGLSKAFGELAHDTEYQVIVTAWSQECEADSVMVKETFWTNEVDSTDDPTVPAAKADPGAPANLTIGRYGENDVEVMWDAPAASDTVCAVSWYDLRFMREGGEWRNTIQSFTVQRYGDEYVAGGKYTANVYSYSWECDQWSLATEATQTLE